MGHGAADSAASTFEHIHKPAIVQTTVPARMIRFKFPARFILCLPMGL
jgi:hypothetical protein